MKRMQLFSAVLLSSLVAIVSLPVQAANTVQDFTAVFTDPGGAPALRASGETAEVINHFDGQAFRLTDEVNSQSGALAFNQLASGPYDELRFDFLLSFSPGNGSGADGIGFAYANVADWGVDNTSPIPPWPTSEEPNLAGSFGVGFDTFNSEGDFGENTVSLHWDGAVLDSLPLEDTDLFSIETGSPIQTSVVVTPSGTGSNVTVSLVDLDTGEMAVPFENEFVPGFVPYDGRMVFRGRTGGANSEQVVDNVTLTHTPQGGGQPTIFTQDFEGLPLGPIEDQAETNPPVLVGGTPFAQTQLGGEPGPRVINDGEGFGEQPGHLRLSEEVSNQHNFIAFDKTSNSAEDITATFNFRILSNEPSHADGMGFVLASTDEYGDSGPLVEDGPYWSPAEDPNLIGGLGIGFDTFDNDEEGAFDPTGCGDVGTCDDRRANHISLHWDGAQVGDPIVLPLDELDLANGEWNDALVTVTPVEGGANVSVVLTDGTDGSVHALVADQFVAGLDFASGARAAFGARTGGAFDMHEFDNINISFGGTGLVGDFNGDGVLDVQDVDQLSAESASGANNSAFDVTGDGAVNGQDLVTWAKDLRGTWIGDANVDGEFSSSDLVQIFQAGKFEQDTAAVWSEGDWTGDGRFNSSDLVAAFQDGGFEQGPVAAVSAVPEPTGCLLLLLGAFGLLGRARRRQR